MNIGEAFFVVLAIALAGLDEAFPLIKALRACVLHKGPEGQLWAAGLGITQQRPPDASVLGCWIEGRVAERNSIPS